MKGHRAVEMGAYFSGGAAFREGWGPQRVFKLQHRKMETHFFLMSRTVQRHSGLRSDQSSRKDPSY